MVLFFTCVCLSITNLVDATPPTVLADFFLNFASVFCLGLKMCMTFDCKPKINFYHFSQFELESFLGLKHIDIGYL